MAEPITVVGGGLAGLTLGIGLLQRGVPVTIWEAGHFPRHHTCGEFISGAGQGTLERLNLLPALRAASTHVASTMMFFDGRRHTQVLALRQHAMCISRHVLDAWMAQEFQRLGGELRVGKRWHGVVGEGGVRATGRRSEQPADGWRFFALKVHVRDVILAADLEMHVVPDGYVGLCRLADGMVNICGLFRTQTAVVGLRQHWREWLAGPPGSILRERLDAAVFDDESQCTAAGFSLRPGFAAERNECCIGDALTMIPPVTGNGMSIAFESAELAIAPILAYSQGGLPWPNARAQIATACDGRFRRRLRWADCLQKALFQPLARRLMLSVIGRSDRLTQTIFSLTR